MPKPIYSINKLEITNNNANRLYIKQFDIHRGACYVFEGKMGCGKTTFLKTLYSKSTTYKGEIHFEGENIKMYSKAEYYNQIAVVPQIVNLPWIDIKVDKYLHNVLSKYQQIRNPSKRLEDICKKMQLTNFLDRKIKSLTPGELRWIILAAQICTDSKVLFIDEYEQHLGKDSIKKLNNILYRKINYDGTTLISSTQNKELLNRLASVVITLENGRITGLRSSGRKKESNKNRNTK